MNEWLVFAYEDHEAAGGSEDFVKSFETYEEAETWVKALPRSYSYNEALIAHYDGVKLQSRKSFCYNNGTGFEPYGRLFKNKCER